MRLFAKISAINWMKSNFGEAILNRTPDKFLELNLYLLSHPSSAPRTAPDAKCSHLSVSFISSSMSCSYRHLARDKAKNMRNAFLMPNGTLIEWNVGWWRQCTFMHMQRRPNNAWKSQTFREFRKIIRSSASKTDFPLHFPHFFPFGLLAEHIRRVCRMMLLSLSNIYRQSLSSCYSIRFEFMCYWSVHRRRHLAQRHPKIRAGVEFNYSPSDVAHKHLVEKRGIRCARSKRNSSTGNMLRSPSNWITKVIVLGWHPPPVAGNRMSWDLCQSCCRPNQSAYFSQFIAICSSVNTVNFVCLQTAE